jgi:GNAT superfamily N-acetyltransferase
MQVTRTYLEITSPQAFHDALVDSPDFAVERVPRPTPALYRHLYRTVGEAYHWRDRWDWSDDAIRAHVAQPEITLYVATRATAVVGWYELRRVPEDRSVEIAYFGLLPGETGRGLGKQLLSCAVRDAWTLGATRVWLHTCTLDHPAALPNYVRRGFVPYKTETYQVETSR